MNKHETLYLMTNFEQINVLIQALENYETTSEHALEDKYAILERLREMNDE